MTIQEQKINELSNYELDLAYRKKLHQLYLHDLLEILNSHYLKNNKLENLDEFTEHDYDRIIRAFEDYKSLYTADYDNWLEAIDNYIDYKRGKKVNVLL